MFLEHVLGHSVEIQDSWHHNRELTLWTLTGVQCNRGQQPSIHVEKAHFKDRRKLLWYSSLKRMLSLPCSIEETKKSVMRWVEMFFSRWCQPHLSLKKFVFWGWGGSTLACIPLGGKCFSWRGSWGLMYGTLTNQSLKTLKNYYFYIFGKGEVGGC